MTDGRFGEGFPPRTVAIVGVSRSEGVRHPGYTGLKLLRMLREARFQGRVYPVNPNATTIDGVRVYPSVTAIPEPLDLVTITVPAAEVPGVLEDCVAAGALNVQVCTSGFAETGDPVRVGLQSRIREIALRGGLRLIGPNCMGFHVPSVRMKMFEDATLDQGPVAFVSQSGGHVRVLLLLAPVYGFGFSKVISYGNALMLDSTDFLEYLATDPETGIVCMYLEGVKDGARLLRQVRELNPRKPVIMWKAGLTSSGARAAGSHTASLAGERRTWDAFFRQTGAIRAGSPEELAELASTFVHLRPLPGRRAALLGAGGGDSVATGDLCAEEGLEVPALSPGTRPKLLEYVSLVNQGVGNPIDVPGVVINVSTLRRTLEVLAADPVVDFIILHLNAEFFAGPLGGPEFKECVSAFNRGSAAGKAVVVVVSNEGAVRETERFAREWREAGIMAYGSLRGGCRALRRFVDYHRFVTEAAADS